MARRCPALVLLAFIAGVSGAGGCGRGAGAEAEYRDTVPPPAEPLVSQVASNGRYGGRFVLGAISAPRTLNPLIAGESNSIDGIDRLFTTLAYFDKQTQQMVPRLATSWERASDGLMWTFHLRRGAAFSDRP